MEETDLPRALSAKFKEDFAYPTIKDRVPVILTQVIDRIYRLHTEIKDKYGEEAAEELKGITGKLSKLKNEIQTNKRIVPLEDGLLDGQLWAEHLKNDEQVQGGESKWFVSPWLLTECYFYRRICEAFKMSSHLNHLDCFQVQKRNALTSSLTAVQGLTAFLRNVTANDQARESPQIAAYFQEFIQIALWGNKCDLSISAGIENSQKLDPIGQLSDLKPYILVDDMPQVWKYLLNQLEVKPEGLQIDIVLDNAGFELFTDLCLAEFLLHHRIAQKVKFHGKCLPWFVSDVTKNDFDWTITELANNKDNQVSAMGKRWQQHLKDGSWVYTSHDFWTLPHAFASMKATCPDLYKELSVADFVIFKGDLNYRKLTGDLKWPSTSLFTNALRGFHPAPLLSIRTLKCDLVVGLNSGRAEKIKKTDKDWMLTGTWAVIQSCDIRQ